MRSASALPSASPRVAGLLAAAALLAGPLSAQRHDPPAILLTPDRVFDGLSMRADWSVLVRGDRIIAAGPGLETGVPADARRVALKGMTLLPGLIEGHSHLLLHPYDEATWNDQVLHEPLALRLAPEVVHALKTLDAAFTTLRELST